jgi:hypothetical protein
MVTPPRAGAPAAGHRVVYLTFANSLGSDPIYSADVDLTDRKILAFRSATEGAGR